ncbi:MAG: hypothetical protein ACM3TN_26645 [Alphaproteobacteria bacterium]
MSQGNPLAKKKSHDEEIRRGLEELQRSGLSLEEASAETVVRLQESFGKGTDVDLAVVFALGKIAEPAAVNALTAIEKTATAREVKKEIRRSLFKLSQRGLTIPRGPESAAVPATPVLTSPPGLEAYMSSVDGSGGRLIWIAKPQINRGLQTMQAMVNDREGLQRVGGAQVPRKELRRMAEEIKTQHNITMISVPWEYADAVIYDAYEKAKASGRGGLDHFHELRAIINPDKPTRQEHPVYRKLDAGSAREGAWRELSRRLLDEPELQYWILDPGWIEPFLAQLQEAQTSRLVLNPIQKEERLAGIVRDAVKTICSGETGPIVQRRLEDMALYFNETGRPDQARLALAVALQVGEGGPGPLDVSFLTGLAQKSIAFYLSQEKTRAEEEASLIVKP